MLESGVPKNFWAEAMNMACFIRNLCPTRALDYKIPSVLWEGEESFNFNVLRLRIFGCKVWFPSDASQKLSARGESGVFLGFEKNTKDGVRVFSLERKRILIRRDVIFEENVFPFQCEKQCDLPVVACDVDETEAVIPILPDSVMRYPKITEVMPSGDVSEPSVSVKEVEVVDLTNDEAISSEEVEQEKIQTVESVIDGIVNDTSELSLNDILSLENDSDFVSDDVVNEVPISSHVNLSVLKPQSNSSSCLKVVMENLEPTSVKEALEGKFRLEWKLAMKEEMEHLSNQGVWELVDRPVNVRVIGSKWIFKVKRKPDGSVQRFKARLVALGCSQIFGVNYEETFSPVVKRETIRLMIALTCEKGWSTKHLDATSAYLNSDLHEVIFMEQPEGFVNEEKGDLVCKLRKSLYGLKQSGREWFQTVSKILKGMCLVPSLHDPCLYFCSDKELYVTLYVDDFGVWGRKESVDWFKGELGKLVQIRDLGEVSELLGLNIRRVSKHCITVDQRAEIQSLLSEHGMSNCNGCKSPLNVDVHEIGKTDKGKEATDSARYRRAIGNLLYLSNCSRPDIAFSVSFLGQFCQNPLYAHWLGVKHLLKYLKHTEDLCLTFSKSGKCLMSYCDADHAQNKYDRKSFTGFVFLLANCAIVWGCRKQQCVAMSTVVAEYYAISMSAVELLWLANLIRELGFEHYAPKPSVMRIDNVGAICHAKNDTVRKTKCVSTRFHYIRDEFKRGNLSFAHVKGSENVADILTKSLPGPRNAYLLVALGLRA